MNKYEFLENIKKTYADGVSLIEKKNADYSTENDPFKNFRMAELIDLPVEKAILLRVLDKLSRMNNVIGREVNVKDEMIEDTLLDAINYLAILKAYVETKTTSRKSSDRIQGQVGSVVRDESWKNTHRDCPSL